MAQPKVLILVTGSVPGAGKSSLAASLAAAIEADGRRVELFREDDIRSHPAFSGVMREFDGAGEVRPGTLVAAAADYVTAARDARAEVFVLDALFPYLPSLLAWGYGDDEIAAFFARLAAVLDGFAVLEVHLVADARTALARAGQREGGDWLENHVGKVSRYRTARQVATLDDVVAYYAAAARRSQALLARAPWPVACICAGGGEAATLAKAQAVIARALPRRSSAPAAGPGRSG